MIRKQYLLFNPYRTIKDVLYLNYAAGDIMCRRVREFLRRSRFGEKNLPISPFLYIRVKNI